ncbi:MAG: hypothetical protein K2Y37_25045 [Pirellulales bacterium]|nr:hypothetical protein [Pirellulales bacterium]
MNSVLRTRSRQFSLRFLLIAVALTALAMHWNGERLAVRRASQELEYAEAAFQTGLIVPEDVVAASMKLVTTSLEYPLCDHLLALKRHRQCVAKTYDIYTLECFQGASTDEAWQRVEAEVRKLRNYVVQAERWASVGKIDSLEP